MEKRYKEENKSLWKISKLISKAQKPEQLISGILKEAARLLNGDSSFVWIIQENNKNLVKGYKLSREYKSKISLKIEEEFIKKNIKINQTFSSSNIEKDSRIFFPEILIKEGIISLICAPIKAEDKLIGILIVFSKKNKVWTKRENRIINMLAEQTAHILERMRYQKHIEDSSIRDWLTGLYSRVYFLTRAQEEIARSSRKRECVSFLFCDIDQFKAYNRIEGYTEGDRLLCQTAKSIESSLRKEDTLCRYGGDEFVILLPNTDPAQAKRIAKRVNKAFIKSIEADTHALLLNLSIGIASYPVHGSSIEDILVKADRSMTFAKHSSTGKKVFIWDQWKIKANEAKYYEEDLLPEIINALAKAANLKDGYTSEHARLVSERASLFAKRIGLGEKSIRIIKTASHLYDIGKLIIPEHILNKPAPLNQEEWEIIKRNAENSIRMIKYIRGLENIIPVIKEIRETWNGKGYPNGLSGEQISMEARLIALVDAYQALISTRPYRKKLRKEEAIKELQNEAGKKFDPKMVKDFLQTLP
jgi:diguanylate cyclase (GGDEF)-like protein